MAEYRQMSVEGSSWVRVPRVITENPRGGLPVMVAIEERVTVLGDRALSELQPIPLQAVYTPGYTFPLRDPVTDELTGAVGTDEDVQLYVYSRVRAMQDARDQAEAAAAQGGGE